MTILSNKNSNSFNELEHLVASAQTPEDLQAAADLIAEAEKLKGSGVNPARWTVETLGEVAAFFGVEGQTVREWRTGSNRMPGEQGQWDLSEITQWRCNRLKALGANAKSPEQAEIELAMLKEDLKKKELANRLKAGELVSRVAIKAKVAEMFNEARMGMEALPELLGPMLPPETRTDTTIKVGQAVNLHLRKMAQKAKGCVE